MNTMLEEKIFNLEEEREKTLDQQEKVTKQF